MPLLPGVESAGREIAARKIVLRFGRGLALLALLTASSYGMWQVWMHVRPQPPNTSYALFQGITYRRDVRRLPRPLVIHIVTIDLDAPGLSFVVTPGTPGAFRPLRARKTSAFLAEFGAQLAINADFFYPWYSHSPLSYYPHVGDPITVEALAASRGVVYHATPLTGPRFPTLYLSRDNHARFGYATDTGTDPLSANPAGARAGEPGTRHDDRRHDNGPRKPFAPPLPLRHALDAMPNSAQTAPLYPLYNAVSGNRMLLQSGAACKGTPAEETELNPRTAVGLDRSGRVMILVLVDGRQPNYSEGATLAELTGILRQYGAQAAMNFDGGGSSTLVIADPARGPQILNCPIDGRIPDRERPVANHLGVFARPL